MYRASILVALSLASLASTHAAVITWGNAFNVGNIGIAPTDVFYQGTFSSTFPSVTPAQRTVMGYNVQNNPYTITNLVGDDIAFNFNSFANLTSGFDGGSPGTSDATLDLLLEQMVWPGNRGGNNPTPITTQIPNLIPGQLYEIQLFAGDDRNAGSSNRTINFSDTAGNTAGPFRLGDFPTVYGSFIADATTQDLVVQGSAHPYLSAVVVYTIPEPSRAMLLLLGVAGLLGRRRHS